MATAVLIGLTAGPRLAARGKRIQAAHDSRDRFGESVLDILALCSNLEKVHVQSEVRDLSGLVRFKVVQHEALAVPVAGFPVDHGRVLVRGDRLLKPARLP